MDEPGKFANWNAPPCNGTEGRPLEFEYFKLHDCGAPQGRGKLLVILNAMVLAGTHGRVLLDLRHNCCLVTDGAHEEQSDGALRFQALPPPPPERMTAVLAQVHGIRPIDRVVT